MGNSKRNLLIFFVVLAVFAISSWAIRHYAFDSAESVKEVEREKKAVLVSDTSSESLYDHTITVALDSFSGYAVLRSDALVNQLRRASIKLQLVDDGADYNRRMRSLANREVQLAVFTIDSFLAAGAKLGEYPASIVFIIDETTGADKIVAYKDAVPSLRDMDDSSARFVLTADSPSEFIGRIVISQLNLASLPLKDWFQPADGSTAVLEAIKSADKSAPRAYVLWEPEASMALAIPGVHELLGSQDLRGLIVDVLVVERRFLIDHPDLVEVFIKAYAGSRYSYGRSDAKMARLIAKTSGDQALEKAQLDALVRGIEWKNMNENYEYFGVLPSGEGVGLTHIEDMIGDIMEILLQTDKLNKDPIEGKHHTLFYDGIVRKLHRENYHPGLRSTIVKGLGEGSVNDLQRGRGVAALRPLSELEWGNLDPVASVQVRDVAFSRGNAEISSLSRRDLEHLARRLRLFPNFYIRVVGRARAEGDREANLALAKKRAQSTVNYLVGQGIAKARLRAEGQVEQEGKGRAQSVTFLLGTYAGRD